MEKKIVILANSVKNHNHCVAGKLLDGSKKWIRPVSNLDGAALSDEQAQCQNPYGKFLVKPLQKVSIGLASHSPLKNHQPENHVIDGTMWKQEYKIDKDDLVNYLDNPDDIWGSGGRVSYDQIGSGEFTVTQSLYLIQVEDLKLYKRKSDNKRRASFNYNGANYELAVTDPEFDKIAIQEKMGILCVSLGEEYHGYCYKIVATIF